MIVEIGVSILSLDYEDIASVEQALMRAETANSVHLDVMDGSFVKNKTFGPELVDKLNTRLRKVVHLMVKEPEKEAPKYMDSADTIVFHVEASKKPMELLKKIKKQGVKAGLAVNPGTQLKKFVKYLSETDLLLIMTVHPGRGGQKMLKTPLKKLKSVRKKYPAMDIAVDGGINDETAHSAIEAGANILVSGSYVFKSPEPKLAIDLLRNA